jgi:DNA polymerase V
MISATTTVEIPLAFSTVQAGFPSPAEDYSEGHLDIHRHLVKRPASTILFRPADDSMSDFGIYQDDIVLVDLSLKPENGKIVLVEMGGERVLRRFTKARGRIVLDTGQDSYSQDVSETTDVEFMGRATYVIHAL